MTLEQCKRLKEMGFPQDIGISAYWELSKDRIELWHTRNLHMATEICCNPTAEEALEWVEDKLYMPAKVSNAITVVQGVGWVNISVGIYGHVEKTPYFGKVFDTLSDAV